jgi:hypothetical protein
LRGYNTSIVWIGRPIEASPRILASLGVWGFACAVLILLSARVQHFVLDFIRSSFRLPDHSTPTQGHEPSDMPRGAGVLSVIVFLVFILFEDCTHVSLLVAAVSPVRVLEP